MSTDESLAAAAREIGKFAIRTSQTGEATEAAVGCFLAGVTLLSFAQDCNPSVDGEALMEKIFDHLRHSFSVLTSEAHAGAKH